MDYIIWSERKMTMRVQECGLWVPGRVYSCVMWIFRIIKFLFGLWLRTQGPQGRLIRLAGTHLLGRILKNAQQNSENFPEFRGRDVRYKGQQASRMRADPVRTEKRIMRIGLVLLIVLIFLAMLVLVPVLWVNWFVGASQLIGGQLFDVACVKQSIRKKRMRSHDKYTS